MSARVFWYPSPTSFYGLDIGVPLTGLEEMEQRAESILDSASGFRRHLQFFGNRAVTVKSQRTGSPDLATEFESLQNHIRSRNIVAVAESENTTLAGWAISPPQPGDYSVQFYNDFSAWGPVTVELDDRFILCSPDGYQREEVIVTGYDGFTLSLSTQVRMAHTACFIRHKSFHPFLRIRSTGSPMVVHDRRITWDLDLPMEEPPLLPTGGPPPPGPWAGPEGGSEATAAGLHLLPPGVRTFWNSR